MSKHPLNELDCRKLLVSPSVLASDFANLASEMKSMEIAGADMIHLDVMDGHFVPNISFGPSVIAAMRKYTVLPFDVHLMISHPLQYLKAFEKAGADHITFHIECDDDPCEIIRQIHALGCSAGITLKPGTPVTALEPYLSNVEMVLVMSVEPGFGGQSFMPEQLGKARWLRDRLNAAGSRAHIEIDGGLSEANVRLAAEAGVNVIVAGTSVFKHKDGHAAGVAVLHAAQSALTR